MKSNNFFTRFFMVVLATTIASLAMAAFSVKQAYKSDPELISKIEKLYNIRLHMSGLSFTVSDDNNGSATQDQWELNPPTKRLVIKSFSGKVSMKSSSDRKISVIASGKQNKEKSPRLLEVNQTTDEITLTEPENAVKNLEILINVPTSYSKEIEITSVSGNISIEKMKLELANFKTVSGDITLNHLGLLNLNTTTVSGDINIHDSKIEKVSGKSVSGDFEFDSQITVSSHLTSISGAVKLKMPKTTNYDFNLSSVSGKIKNSQPIETDSKKNTLKISIDIKTTSGDIEIE
ncbi:MAG: DUF4097 family beta strand repeat protein [Bdellovibrionales bacterium]|nr:DUF4097 family beta strand repeat protein [Bdellovibrionales bacterium]